MLWRLTWQLTGDLIQSQKTRVLRFKDSFSKKNFNFPSSFSDYSLSSLKYLSQTLHVSSEKASIFASCLLQTSRKRRVFSISLHCSWFEIYFLDLWDTTVFFEIICSNMGLPKMLGMIVWDWFLLLLSLFSVIFFFIRLLVCVLSIVIW